VEDSIVATKVARNLEHSLLWTVSVFI
jgi:hypothetical protein